VPVAAPVAAQDDGRPKTDLASSIATALKSAPDTKFLSADLSSEDEKELYTVLLLGAGVLHEVKLDPRDGSIIGSQKHELDLATQKEIEAAVEGSAAIPVGKAIAAALDELPGSWACDACLAREGEQPCYSVLARSGEISKVVMVSALDGKVLSVSDPEEEEEEGMEESVLPSAEPK
jgi:uncharacterized membrane protein YkoI